MPERGHKDTDLLAIGRAIRRLREQRDMTADELASAADIDRRRLDALETGRLDPTYEMLVELAEGLDIQPSELVILAEKLKEPNDP